ncbi:MAG: CRISPR system precrRNA processing endoribonuclease RAMP protein Cas6 [Fervidicoccaceae archaeon]
MEPKVKGYRIIIDVEASQPVIEFTGRLTKAFVFALNPELQSFRGIEGIVSPIHISPLFKVSGDHDLGEPAYPYIEKKPKRKMEITPITLNSEYIFHIGGEANLVSKVVTKLEKLSDPLLMRIHNNIIRFRVEKVVDVAGEVFEKASSISERVRVYLKSPAQIFNVFTATKLQKFTSSAVEILMTPYAILNNNYTITEQLVTSSFSTLGKLVETWYSVRTLKPVEIIFKEKKQTNLAGSVTYIIQERDSKKLKTIQNVVAVAELVGIGRSRQNGFGTVIIK